jgi:hypothetical protein
MSAHRLARHLRAEGYCLACREYVDQIRARMSTVFGLEDERVLNGRCRVY